MDEEMVDVSEGRFSPVEIDFDYEFDACRYFDFIREESPAESREAELWFERAGSYPPSPFVEKLNLGKVILVKDINSSPKSKDVENTGFTANRSDDGIGPVFSALDESNQDHEQMSDGIFRNSTGGVPQKVQNDEQALPTGLSFYNHMAKDIPKAKLKHASKGPCPRSSTLMKPTASHLAKQNQPRDACVSNRFFERSGMPFVRNSGRSFDNLSGVESQAAKRQKLEGGHLRKVAGTKQHAILAHKVTKKDKPVDGNVVHSKLKLTIPREPELETAQRAQRTRPKNNAELEEHQKSTCTFKARPLNRKILKAPSLQLPQKSTPRLPEFQEFRLKTSERAVQHSTSAVSSPSRNISHKVAANSSCVAHNATINSKRSISGDNPKEECELADHFKARPFNKKIFSSKGEIGIFRNSKREVTVPMEFDFSTDKRSQHRPPIELFNKLSLTPGLQQNNASQPKVAWSSSVHAKGSKENTPGPFRREHVIAAMNNEKHQRVGEKQTQCCSDRRIFEFRPQANTNRSLGIR
ncbi:protein TPX2-like isoform X2 [Telopea speciosissima]|uniref:protein TPX2-like isoform X2 n=1 Tax=Telopea speciosissima TaxID=54955 RepID=UPI001CC7B69C|nr:protein TPX2-like isoform X2 [Telopea speciosissima]